MNELVKPNWIKRREIQIAKGETATQRALILSLRVKAEGPEFWRQVLIELASNIDAMSGIGVRGKVSSFGASEEKQQRCRIDVAQSGSVRGMTYTDLFYTPGETNIECRTLEGDKSGFAFCILADQKLGVVSDEFSLLSAQEMAETLVEQCVKRLCGEDS